MVAILPPQSVKSTALEIFSTTPSKNVQNRDICFLKNRPFFEILALKTISSKILLIIQIYISQLIPIPKPTKQKSIFLWSLNLLSNSMDTHTETDQVGIPKNNSTLLWELFSISNWVLAFTSSSIYIDDPIRNGFSIMVLTFFYYIGRFKIYSGICVFQAK